MKREQCVAGARVEWAVGGADYGAPGTVYGQPTPNGMVHVRYDDGVLGIVHPSQLRLAAGGVFGGGGE